MKILFVNHSAARTGAPIVLLHLLNWLKQEKNLSFDVLSLQKGDMLEAFTGVGNKHYFNKRQESLLVKVVDYINSKKQKNRVGKLMYPKKALKAIARNNYDLIYANSVISIPAGSYIKEQSVNSPKLLVHMHELNAVINLYCPELKIYQKDIDFTIAVSNKVKNNLIGNWGFKENKIKVVYAHSKVEFTHNNTTKEFVVGASGIVDWRKGPDFFLLVAQYVFKKIPQAQIKFQWVGRISKANRLIYEEDLKRLKLQDKVEFTGAKENPHDYFSNFDVFLMTSKEDPFPLVCIEVGLLGKPIICFEGATGTEEVLLPIKDSVVPYLDIEKMGEAVLKYYNQVHLKIENGEKTKQIFQEFTPEKQGIKILDILTELKCFNK